MHDRAGLVRGDQGVDRLGVQQIHISGNQGAPPLGARQLRGRRLGRVGAQIQCDDGAPAVEQDPGAAGTDLTECAR